MEPRLGNPKAREPHIKSAEAVGPAEPIATADGKVLKSTAFVPKPTGEWERKAFGEQGDYWLVFAVSAHTERDYKAAMKAYEAMVRSYREKR